MKLAIVISELLILCSCVNQNNKSSGQKTEINTEFKSSPTVKDSLKQIVNQKELVANNLVDIQQVNPKILIDLKYATSDNFMKIKLYARINRAYLQKDVALRLSACQDYLSELKPGCKLLIYDALRPVSVQLKMWNALDSLPPSERGKFVSNPKNRSLHNLGAAVDLTICDEQGSALDMGAGYDDFREIAYPEMESYFLKSGELTKQHIENRELLRKVMRKEGFRNIPTEWWHFNACSRNEGVLKYKVLLEEP